MSEVKLHENQLNLQSYKKAADTTQEITAAVSTHNESTDAHADLRGAVSQNAQANTQTAGDLTAHKEDKSNPHEVSKEQVGLGNVDNTADVNKPVSSATQAALDLKADSTSLSAHTEKTDNPHQVTKTQVGLGNVDNTADSAKPISTATQAALDLKADNTALSSHIEDTENPHSVTKAQIGLGNVDNTADSAKPVSTAQQAALDLKANIEDMNTALNAKANASDVNASLSNKADKASSLAGYGISDAYTKNEADNNFAAKSESPTKTSDLENDSGFITKDVNNLTNYTTTANLNSALSKKANSDSVYHVSEMDEFLEQKADKSTVNTELSKKANTTDVNSALALKADAATVNAGLEVKADKDELADVAFSGNYNDLSGKPSIPTPYTLPVATASTLGGIMLGAGLSSDENGVVSVTGGGGGGNVSVDEETIVKDSNNTITAVGVKTKNDEIKYDWIGTLAEYEAGRANQTIPDSWMCFITDDVDPEDFDAKLTEKADTDLSNINASAAAKEQIVGWGMPDFSAGVSKAWNTDITASTDCYVFVLGNGTLNNPCDVYVDGVHVFVDLNSGQYSPRTSGLIPVSKGSVYKATCNNGGTLTEYPLKGVN